MKIVKDTLIVFVIISLVGFILPWMISSKHTELVILAAIGCIATGVYIVNFLTKNAFKIREFLNKE